MILQHLWQTKTSVCTWGWILFTLWSSESSCFLEKVWGSLLMCYEVINVAWYLLWQLLCTLFNHLHHGSQLFSPFISLLPMLLRENDATHMLINFSALCVFPLFIFTSKVSLFVFFFLLFNKRTERCSRCEYYWNTVFLKYLDSDGRELVCSPHSFNRYFGYALKVLLWYLRKL